MARSISPKTKVQKQGHARARNLRRDVVATILQATDDAGLSRRGICAAAGVGPNTLAALERDDREPTIEVLSRLAAALGGELSVRFHPGTGPAVRDHLQAAMVEGLIRALHPRWRAEVEVPVFTPTRGVIDVVLRDEQRHGDRVRSAVGGQAAGTAGPLGTHQVRGACRIRLRDDAASRILLLRTTSSTRSLVSGYPETMRAAYPGGHREAVAALVGETTWPGAAIVWMDVHGGIAVLRRSSAPGSARSGDEVAGSAVHRVRVTFASDGARWATVRHDSHDCHHPRCDPSWNVPDDVLFGRGPRDIRPN